MTNRLSFHRLGLLAVAGLCAILAACGNPTSTGAGTSGPAQGSLGGACYGNGTCNIDVPLKCISGTCQLPDVGGDVAVEPDVPVSPDVAVAADVAVGPDVAVAADVDVTPDMVAPPDVQESPDVAVAVDATAGNDAATTPDVATEDIASPDTGGDTAPSTDTKGCTPVCTNKLCGDDGCGGWCGSSPKACNDGLVCTDDSCDPQTGCVNSDNSKPCNDNDACTSADTCSGGACSGTPKSCSDGNMCTADSCVAGACQVQNLTDGTACGSGLECVKGQCKTICLPSCIIGTCGIDDKCGGTCACNGGTFCTSDGICVADCPTGQACTPDPATCHTVGKFACSNGTVFCAPTAGSLSPDGAFCDGGTGKKACNAGKCLACSPPAIILPDILYNNELSLTFKSLGIGIDSATNDTKGQCVELPPAADYCATAKVTSSFESDFAKSTSALVDMLKVDAAAHYSSGIYNASGSVNYEKSSKITNDSVFLVLKIDATFADAALANPSLTAEKLALLQADPVGFLQGCGDEYVDSLSSGGYFRLIYQFKGVEKTAKEDLTIKLSVNGGNWGANGTFQKNLSDVSTQYETHVSVIKSGGGLVSGATQLAGPYGQGLICEARCFLDANAKEDNGNSCNCPSGSTLTCANSTATAMHAKPYQSVANWPKNTNLPSTADQRAIIHDTATSALQVKFALNDVQYRLANNVDKLKGVAACAGELKNLTDHQKALTDWISLAEARIKACQTIYVCGPSLACTNALPPMPSLDLPLMSPDMVQTCGPICTTAPDATYEIDAFGYCTRCTFAPPKTAGTGVFPGWTTAGKVMETPTCRYMRPGAFVHMAACGKLVNNNYVYPAGMRVTMVARSGAGEADVGKCNANPLENGTPLSTCSLGKSFPNWSVYNLYDDVKVAATGDNHMQAAMAIGDCASGVDGVANTTQNFDCSLQDQAVMICDVDAVPSCGVTCN